MVDPSCHISMVMSSGRANTSAPPNARASAFRNRPSAPATVPPTAIPPTCPCPGCSLPPGCAGVNRGAARSAPEPRDGLFNDLNFCFRNEIHYGLSDEDPGRTARVPAKLIFRVHALRRMFVRGITAAEVRDVVERGETIERYPRDVPYPSRLLLGVVGGRTLHVVVADNEDDGETVVVTTYEPDPGLWQPGFRRRRK
jgi:hypothetical protein